MRRIETVAVGEGRTRVVADVHEVGRDLLVFVGGEGEHVGTATLAQQIPEEEMSLQRIVARVQHRPERTHKEGEITDLLSAVLAEATGRLTLVVAGIHLDGITHEEIEAIRRNVGELSRRLVERLRLQ